MTLSAPTPATAGWGVQFYRRVLGPNPWVLHGTRDTTAPFSRAATVTAGGWDTKAVWSRADALTVVETYRTVECR